jgi:hypothetical protein
MTKQDRINNEKFEKMCRESLSTKMLHAYHEECKIGLLTKKRKYRASSDPYKKLYLLDKNTRNFCATKYKYAIHIIELILFERQVLNTTNENVFED